MKDFSYQVDEVNKADVTEQKMKMKQIKNYHHG